MRQKRKVVEATVPARIKGPGLVARTSNETQLQKSSGGVWPRISSANALQKERQGRVNGGLAFGDGRRVTPSSGTESERYVGASASPGCERARTGRRPRVARERHSAVAPSPERR